ncbi:hypothetical protein D2T81_32530, partial [Azospirillum brasilense]
MIEHSRNKYLPDGIESCPNVPRPSLAKKQSRQTGRPFWPICAPASGAWKGWAGRGRGCCPS